jgi:RNA polymerase sigma factor (TIGR02999 family)
MSAGAAPEVARLLAEVETGNKAAVDRLSAIVYDDLHRLAASHLRRRFGADAENITLAPTVLVHETYLRMVKQRRAFDSLGHFFAIATKVMLRVLVDYQREKHAAKRGGGQVRVTLSGVGEREATPVDAGIEELIEALEQLEALDARGAEVVKLRVLWGLTVPEIAETLEVSPSTIEREWRFARRWLASRLADGT